MKRLLLAAALAAMTAPAPADAGVSVEVGAPGFYGRLDIGGFPTPRLVFPEPVIIHRVRFMGPPIYLHVPPGHAKDWGKHCRRYDACGRQVYFVQESWYNDVYVPGYRKRHWSPGDGRGQSHGGGHGKGHGKGHKGH